MLFVPSLDFVAIPSTRLKGYWLDADASFARGVRVSVLFIVIFDCGAKKTQNAWPGQCVRLLMPPPPPPHFNSEAKCLGNPASLMHERRRLAAAAATPLHLCSAERRPQFSEKVFKTRKMLTVMSLKSTNWKRFFKQIYRYALSLRFECYRPIYTGFSHY